MSPPPWTKTCTFWFAVPAARCTTWAASPTVICGIGGGGGGDGAREDVQVGDMRPVDLSADGGPAVGDLDVQVQGVHRVSAVDEDLDLLIGLVRDQRSVTDVDGGRRPGRAGQRDRRRARR